MSKSNNPTYIAERLARTKIRKATRKAKAKNVHNYKYTHDEYSCPRCGLNSLHASSTMWYSYICKCGNEYETPDT